MGAVTSSATSTMLSGVRWTLAADVLKVREDALAKLPDVCRPFAQVGILHFFEHGGLFKNRLLECALRPLAAADSIADVAGQGGIVEHVQIGVEEFAFLRAQILGHLFVDALDVGTRLPDGLLE